MKPAFIATAMLFVAGHAFADPCEAIPDKGPMPAYLHAGGTFRGAVVYVPDGESFCVAVGKYAKLPENWVEIRLARVRAPQLNAPGGREAKKTLERIAMGRRVWCRAQHRSRDQVVASCTIDGSEIGDLIRSAHAERGGTGR